uniref:Protein Mis18-alpha n=1 Tax=Acanthochromis polyacanthus TaxID=80966 RepID=A0A3Q1EE92_9TELE
MASAKQSLRYRQKRVNSTFETSSIDSTAVEEKLFRQVALEEDGGDDPVVFICAKCRLPVGDSLSWDGSEDGQNQIRLKRVTDNVLIGKESHLYEPSKRSRCLIVNLMCRGCHSVLGMVYTSTPKNLDHKRFSFCFHVADIDRYGLLCSRLRCPTDGAFSLITNAQVVLRMTSAQFWETLTAITGRLLFQTLPHLSRSSPANKFIFYAIRTD